MASFFCSENNSPTSSTTISLYNSNTDYLNEEKIYIKLANASTPELACSFCNEYGSILPKCSTSDGINVFLEKGVFNSHETNENSNRILYKHFQTYQVTMHHLTHIYNLIQCKDLSSPTLVSLFHHCIDIMLNPHFNDLFEIEYDNPTHKDEMLYQLTNYPLIQFILDISTYQSHKHHIFSLIDKETGEATKFKYYEHYYQTISVQQLKDKLSTFPEKSFKEFLTRTLDYDLNDSSNDTITYIKNNRKQFVSFAKYIFSEFLSYFIRDTIPIVSFDSFDNISSWKFSSLANAIFFYFYMDCSNGNIYKVCANDYCQKLFACSPAYKKKIYCSANCAHKVANRKWKKKQSTKNKN